MDESEGEEDGESKAESETWQERIVRWRFQSNSTPKRIIGFWLKASIELFVIVGIPVGIFVLATTSIADIPLSSLPLQPTGTQSRVISWIILSVSGWYALRCMLTENLDLSNGE